MHQPSKWWTGLIPLAAIWAASGFFGIGPVESDLAPRAREIIVQIAPDVASAINVRIEGRDALIDGLEFTAGQGDRIGQAVADAHGVRLVSAGFKPVPAARPYPFSATRAGDQFILAGSAPLPIARDRLIEAARAAAPGATIVDKLAYAAGAPDGFEAIAARGLGEAAKLDEGAFILVDKAYSIAGNASTSAIYESAIASAQQLPEGATLAKAAIQPPEAKPFAWSATFDGVAATIGGAAPSIEARAAIARAASSSLPGKMIVDRMQIARGAPTDDFAASAVYALAELGRLSKGRVGIADGAYSISGEAKTAQTYDAAMAGLRQLPQGLSLARADILAPEIKPYVWSIANDGGRVTLSGMAPSALARDSMFRAAAALFPGKTIANDMGIARGAPDGEFARAAGAAMAELAKLASGQATLTDTQLSLRGLGAAEFNNAAVSASARAALPAPFAVASVDIVELPISPYVFKLVKADGKVAVSGYAPDEKARQDILAAAKSAFSSDTIEDALKIGKGAPANFVNALKAIFPTLARLASGAVAISDGAVSVEGLAAYESAIDQIKASLASLLPQGFKLAGAAISARAPEPATDPKLCQSNYNDALSKGRILFDTASARLTKTSAATLDALIGVLQSCRDIAVEVGGHTDSVGAPTRNLALSKRRAAAVAAYIANTGIDTSRIATAGYGDAKPIAPNTTAEGRAQNRRIEFLVK